MMDTCSDVVELIDANKNVKLNAISPEHVNDVRSNKNNNNTTKLEDDNVVQECSVRSLNKRSSVENFGIFGLLTPLLALAPYADGCDALTTTFEKLKGEDRSLRLAAAHIEDALTGRGKYGKARAYFKPKLPQKCFYIYSNVWYTRFILVVIVLHALLIFFEPPSQPISDVNPVVYIVNAVCLLVFIFDLFVHITFLSWSIFWSKKTEESYWNGVQFVLVCIFGMDFLLLTFGYFFEEYLYPPFRCFRLVMVLCKVKNIRNIFHVLLIILTRILKMLVIILAFIVVFACIGVHQYMDIYNNVFEQENDTYNSTACCVNAEEEKTYIGAFDNVVKAMLRLLVLLSTENYPTFMLPAFRHNQVNFFFFGTFVFVGVFFLTAILLAIIVDSYWLDAKKHVKKNRARERAELAKAWNLIDPCGYELVSVKGLRLFNSFLGQGAVDTYDLKFLKLFQRLKPKNTDEQNQILIELLDSNRDGYIDSFEWTTSLRQALEAEFEQNSDEFGMNVRVELGCYAQMQEKAKSIIESEFFSRWILILIFLHVCSFTLKWKGQDEVIALIVHGFRSLIVFLFMMESVLKIIGFGSKLLKQLELLDVILVLLATIFNLACYFYIRTSKYDLFIVLSSLCIFMRLFLNSAQTRHALRWFLNIAPVMIDLMILLLISIYLLAVIGMELFQGYPIRHDIERKVYLNYCGIGFETFACSLLMLFQMLSTSNWHDIMNMVYESTGRAWTVVYFIFVYIVITMVIMNLFVAIAIEAANKLGRSAAEYKQQQYDAKHQKKSFKKKAATVLHTLANSFLGTTRIEDISQRNELTQALSNPSISTGLKRKRVSTTIILRQQNNMLSKKISVVQFQEPIIESLQEQHDMKKVEEDYNSVATDAGLEEEVPKPTAREKRKQKILNRIKQRKEEHRKKRVDEEIEIAKEVEKETEELERIRSIALTHTQAQCRVVVAFKPTHNGQLNVTVGEVVNVLEQVDDWIHGELNGRIGWIPASHVIIRREKEVDGLTSSSNNPIIIPRMELPPEDVDYYSRQQSSDTQISNSKHRIKMKRAGDWTRDILGEITVMNAEEMRELNKVMRAEMKASSFRRKVAPAKVQRGYSVASEETVLSEAASAASTKKTELQPQRLTSKVPDFPTTELDEKKSPPTLVPLKVSIDSVKTPTPSPPNSPIPDCGVVERLRPSNAPKRPVKPNEDGTPPEWMKNFASSNNLVLDDDAKMSKDQDTRSQSSKRSSVIFAIPYENASEKKRASDELQAPISLKRKRSPVPLRSSLVTASNMRKRSSSTVTPANFSREEASLITRSSVTANDSSTILKSAQNSVRTSTDSNKLGMPPSDITLKEEEIRRILASKQYEQNVKNDEEETKNVTLVSVSTNDVAF